MGLTEPDLATLDGIAAAARTLAGGSGLPELEAIARALEEYLRPMDWREHARLRLALGLTQVELAERMETSRAWISLLENAGRPVPREHALALRQMAAELIPCAATAALPPARP